MIEQWLEIGSRNTWIGSAVDPPFDRFSFCACASVADLAFRLGETWVEGQAFYLDDVCFINQDRGGHEWLVIRKGVSFESLSGWAYKQGDKLEDFLDRIHKASVEQLLNLTY